MSRENVYANQVREGDRIEVVVTVDRAEASGETVLLHVSGTLRLQADEQLWRQT